MKMPKVSIIMPIHNGAQTLNRAIDSVVDQTFADWELICVINLCDDNSKELAQLSATFDNRIRVIECAEKGIVPALNFGILHSKGEFIARQDADDLWYKDKLAKQVKYLEDFQNIDIVGTQIRQVDPENFEVVPSQIRYPLNDREIKMTLLRGSNCIAHPSVVFRKRIIYRAGLYDDTYPLAEDYYYWLRCIRWYNFANLTETMVDYTSNPNPNYNPRVPLQACQNIHDLYRQIGIIK